MRISESEYRAAFNKFQNSRPAVWLKYAAPGAEQTLLDYLFEQQQPPSQTTVELSIAALYQQGSLARVDGKTPVHDARENLQQVLAEVGAAPLTTEEIREFAALPPQEVAAKYWDDFPNAFSVRYDKAIREAGFIQPGRISSAASTKSAEGGESELTADQYRNLSADQLKQLLRTPKGKTAVYKLIKAGKI